MIFSIHVFENTHSFVLIEDLNNNIPSVRDQKEEIGVCTLYI